MSDNLKLRFRPIPQLVDELCADVGDPSGHLTAYRMSNLLRTTMEELNLWVIPSYGAFEAGVESNSTVIAPKDCVRPIQVYKIYELNGANVLLPYGRKDTVKPFVGIECLGVDEVRPNTIKPIGEIYNQQELYIFSPEYMEDYGRKSSAFFGFWTFWADYNFIEVSDVKSTDRFIVRYLSDNENLKKLPIDSVGMVKNRVLQQYWATTDVGKAQYYFGQFRVSLKMFQKFRTGGWSPEQWIDIIKREYSPTNR